MRPARVRRGMDVANCHRDDVFPSLDTTFSSCRIAHGENGSIPAPSDRMTSSGRQRRRASEHSASLRLARVREGIHLTLACNQSGVLSRRQQMTAQPSVMKAWWMSSRISPTRRCTPSPEPVFGAASGDVRGDVEPSDLVAVALVVVAAVDAEVLRAAQRLATFASDRRDRSDQWDQLGHVVAVAAGQRGGQRDAVSLDDHVVLAAGLAPVPRGRAPASFHSDTPLQQVIPEPKPSPEGGNAEGYRCRARTGCRIEPAGHRADDVPGTGSAAQSPATATRYAPTDHRQPPTSLGRNHPPRHINAN